MFPYTNPKLSILSFSKIDHLPTFLNNAKKSKYKCNSMSYIGDNKQVSNHKLRIQLKPQSNSNGSVSNNGHIILLTKNFSIIFYYPYNKIKQLKILY